MTPPLPLLLALAIVFHADGAGTYNYEQNMNNTEITNSITNTNKDVSLDTRHKMRIFNETVLKGNSHGRVKRNGLEDRCALFYGQSVIIHPHPINDTKYYSSIDCVTVLNGAEGNILELKFVDLFDIEYHPLCQYDYLEIRDGTRGYAPLLGGSKLCGQQFPGPINTTGPHAWVKFHSDDTIENEGFRIVVSETPSPKSRIITLYCWLCGQQFPGPINTTGPHAWVKFHSDDTIENEGFRIVVSETPSPKSHVVPESCHVKVTGVTGEIGKPYIPQKCKDDSTNQAMEVLWTIETEENYWIALNFTEFVLAKPNSCKENLVQVFGSIVEFDSKFAHFCGSIAEPVSTKFEDATEGNVMNIRYYASKATKDSQKFTAQYTVYRILNTSNKSDQCIKGEEFDCKDGTCISQSLVCDGYANCRLKSDELPEMCKGEIDVFNQDLQVIVIVLSLIVSAMTLVFLFKCFRKLYLDQKIINENLRLSMQNGLDGLLAQDDKSERDIQAGLFLEREKDNLTKQNISKHKEKSMESLNQLSRKNSEIELWRQELNTILEKEKVKERNDNNKRTDMSRKEESLRIENNSVNKAKKKELDKDKRNKQDIDTTNDNDKRNRQDIDISNEKEASSNSSPVNEGDDVATTDVKEFGCQTRDSLFLTEPPPNGKKRKSRSLSIFGYSRAEPSPLQTMASEITIQLLNQPEDPNSANYQTKTRNSRPVSADTTKSAPDVIIVAEPNQF